MPTVTIIDYKVGNIFSMYRSLERTGLKVEVSSNPREILASDGVILPGVGAFGSAARNLSPLKETINECIEQGTPFLGSCLGLQLFFDKSEESAGEGLGIIEGEVKRFRKEVKTPHMGWNNLKIVKETELLKGITGESYFYFVHSYYVQPLRNEVTAAKTCYDVDFTSVVAEGNLFGTQFHPEKSGQQGAQILRNFGDIIER
jgi:glutamine amidotransferase